MSQIVLGRPTYATALNCRRILPDQKVFNFSRVRLFLFVSLLVTLSPKTNYPKSKNRRDDEIGYLFLPLLSSPPLVG